MVNINDEKIIRGALKITFNHKRLRGERAKIYHLTSLKGN